jgi:DinB superfamily
MSLSPTLRRSRQTGATAKGNHSVGQLTYHLLFWNSRSLATFQGHPLPNFKGENTETFDKFDAKSWNDTVSKLNQVMTDLEKVVANASDAQLAQWAPTIANIATHNAYHIGEIVMVRKEQGVWDASKGVK